jgi:hypothetical protein
LEAKKRLIEFGVLDITIHKLIINGQSFQDFPRFSTILSNL